MNHAIDKSGSDKPSILICDDDEVYRNRLARAFVDRGYDVRTASDHDSGLAAAQAESPEFAVIDLKMPGKSGLELVKSMKEMDPTTKTVVLTGYGSIATAIDAVRLGATYYLSKPADADDIVAAFARGEAPPLEPPALWAKFQGFRVRPVALLSVVTVSPISGVVVLPKLLSPAAAKRSNSVEV